MILQWGNTIKVSIELPVATRHRRDMSEKLEVLYYPGSEKLLKATLNPNKQQQQFFLHLGACYSNGNGQIWPKLESEI